MELGQIYPTQGRAEREMVVLVDKPYMRDDGKKVIRLALSAWPHELVVVEVDSLPTPIADSLQSANGNVYALVTVQDGFTSDPGALGLHNWALVGATEN